MAESIPPVPPAPPPPPPTASSPPPPIADVPAPPPRLEQLPPGSRLAATVTAQLGLDTFRVASSAASFTVQTSLPLDEGARLLLLLPERPAASFRVQILTVNDRLAAALSPATAQASAPTTSLPAAPLAIGDTLTATLLSAPRTMGGMAATSAALPGTNSGLLAGVTQGRLTVAPLGVAGIVPPAAGTSPAASAFLNPGAMEGTRGALLAAGRSTTAMAARAVQDYARQSAIGGGEGDRVILRIVSLRPPPSGGPAPTPPALANPGTALLAPSTTVQGIVTGHSSHGFPIVQTPAGLLALATLAEVEAGTEIALRVIGPSTAGSTPVVPSGPSAADDVTALRDWPALRETLAALQAVAPPTARAIAEVLPRFDATLTASVLFLLTSLRGGNLRDWLGETTVRDLQRLRPEAAARISDDFLRLSTSANDSTTDWQRYLLPFHTGNTIHPVQLYLHRHPGDDDEEDKESGTRFVIDIALSRIGRLQIDGLVRERTRRFDLILRTATPLHPTMQDDIRNLFEEALRVSGQSGGIAFRADPSGFVETQPDRPHRPDIVA